MSARPELLLVRCRYNKAAPSEARIKPAGSAGPRALVILLGNSKLVWEPFLEACSRDDSLLALENPFDHYVATAVEGSLEECASR
jgi:hypothetical protein